jgi:asparagine synthetase B (glutamine-hydrolysing)
MCSILITNRSIQQNFFDVNRLLKLRGPDFTGMYSRDGINFVHNLLSISGKFSPQPFVQNNIVAVYNGEIYNADGYQSDGHCLIPRYQLHKELVTQSLDGEFAVCIADFDQSKIIISTDIFGTKPLWLAFDGFDFGISSYRTPLEVLGFSTIQKIPANCILILNFADKTIYKIGEVYSFDLTQHKNHFQDWNRAFKNSIQKRTQNLREQLFIGLSSGYDSGAIACELDQQNIEYQSYTILGEQLSDILPTVLSRISQRNNKRHMFVNEMIKEQAYQYILENVEKFNYTISSSSSDYNEFDLDLRNDSGSIGLSMVCQEAVSQGQKIYLSGMGADEIFSDYGFDGEKIYPHSNFGGLFPEDLKTIFPWNSFYGSTMESYLTKEEYVAGAYGIETRYPFLDKMVVQEFLWLTAELKNSVYKNVLDNYLKHHNYPYTPNQKIGFTI